MTFAILRAILTPFWPHLGPSWGYLGAMLGLSWAFWGHIGNICGASWCTKPAGGFQLFCFSLGPKLANQTWNGTYRKPSNTLEKTIIFAICEESLKRDLMKNCPNLGPSWFRQNHVSAIPWTCWKILQDNLYSWVAFEPCWHCCRCSYWCYYQYYQYYYESSSFCSLVFLLLRTTWDRRTRRPPQSETEA